MYGILKAVLKILGLYLVFIISIILTGVSSILGLFFRVIIWIILIIVSSIIGLLGFLTIRKGRALI